MGLNVGHFFFLGWVVGFCDQRRARMVVIGLGGVAGFSIGLGVKNSWGCGVYTDCRGWFGLVQDLMGQKLERHRHIWLAFSFDSFAFNWLSTVVLYRLEVCFDTKTDVGQPHLQ